MVFCLCACVCVTLNESNAFSDIMYCMWIGVLAWTEEQDEKKRWKKSFVLKIRHEKRLGGGGGLR